jgi:hypothetical protein
MPVELIKTATKKLGEGVQAAKQLTHRLSSIATKSTSFGDSSAGGKTPSSNNSDEEKEKSLGLNNSLSDFSSLSPFHHSSSRKLTSPSTSILSEVSSSSTKRAPSLFSRFRRGSDVSMQSQDSRCTDSSSSGNKAPAVFGHPRRSSDGSSIESGDKRVRVPSAVRKSICAITRLAGHKEHKEDRSDKDVEEHDSNGL